MAKITHADLVDWSQQLPEWQRDALRRVFERGEVEDREIGELAALAKAPHSPAPDPSVAPVPASAAQVSGLDTEFPSVRLVAVRDIARVNALADGPVRFAPQGLTVIYGTNASGKTGIARILKRACRAREPGGPIRPNVFEPDPTEPAAATIDYVVGDGSRSHAWVDGAAGDPALRAVNVFDARCAAIQVEQPNLISYTPALLQVLRDLAATVDRVAEELRRQKAALGGRPAALDELGIDATTAAGAFVHSLRAESDTKKLETLSTLNQAERTRLDVLNRALADDPLRRAEAEEARGRRVRELEVLAGAASQHVSDEPCERFRALVREQRSAEAAAAAARTAFAGSSALPGIGTDAWRALWESARRYSETHAYAGEAFPVVRAGAICALCQQPLTGEAPARLHSFEEFVKADVQRRADTATRELAEAASALRSLPFPPSIHSAVRDAGLRGTEPGSTLRAYLVGARVRARRLLREAAGEVAGVLPPLPLRPDLSPIQGAIKEEAGRLRLAGQADSRLALARERDELRARAALATHVQTIRLEIERLQAGQRSDAALADCKTNLITLKARQVAEATVTNQLRSSFASNLTSVGFNEAPVEVRIGAGDRGEHPYEMKLVARPDVPPGDVLSEGERTCVALAGFLAELETTGNRSGIILDDPVSSLDHHYRKRLAERLVREAKERQVVAFTHDVVFLYLVRKYANELGVSLTEMSLERGYKRNHGRAVEGPPWVAMNVRQRVTRIRNELIEARRVLNTGDRGEYERRASEIYRHLRQSWERAVEEVLLNQVVIRFGDSVQTQRLAKVTDVSDADIETVTREMSRCSDFVHDESGAVHADPPGPEVVETDIARLDQWVTDLRRTRGRS